MLSVCFVQIHIWLQAQCLYLSVENNEKKEDNMYSPEANAFFCLAWLNNKK